MDNEDDHFSNYCSYSNSCFPYFSTSEIQVSKSTLSYGHNSLESQFSTPAYRTRGSYLPGSVGSDVITPESEVLTDDRMTDSNYEDEGLESCLDFGSLCDRNTPKRKKKVAWIRSRVENFKRKFVVLENELENIPDTFTKKLKITKNVEEEIKNLNGNSANDDTKLNGIVKPSLKSPSTKTIGEHGSVRKKRQAEQIVENNQKKTKISPRKVKNPKSFQNTKIPTKDKLSPKKVSPKKLSFGKSLQFSDKVLKTIKEYNLLHDSPSSDYLPVKKIDFLVELGLKRNLPSIVNCIFSYLTPCELYSCSLVSKQWQMLCYENLLVSTKIRKFIAVWKTTKENPPIKNTLKLNCSIPLSSPQKSRKPLSVWKGNERVSVVQKPSSPPVSPGKRKFHVYVKEGQKLNKGETLLPCPKCTFPSRVNTNIKLGHCTSPNCSFNFCTKCLCLSENNHSCDFIITNSPSPNKIKQNTIGSKQSRRALRRL